MKLHRFQAVPVRPCAVRNWRTVAKILDGLPLEPTEIEFYRAISGQDTAPSKATVRLSRSLR